MLKEFFYNVQIKIRKGAFDDVRNTEIVKLKYLN